MTSAIFEYATFGGLRQDYCITHDGQVHLGVLGGNAIYSAVGAKLWAGSVGLISRVGSDFPAEWLNKIQQAGFNITAIKQLSDYLGWEFIAPPPISDAIIELGNKLKDQY